MIFISYLHFTDKETEKQKGYKTCSRSVAGELRARRGSQALSLQVLWLYNNSKLLLKCPKHQHKPKQITFTSKQMKDNSDNKGMPFSVVKLKYNCITSKKNIKQSQIAKLVYIYDSQEILRFNSHLNSWAEKQEQYFFLWNFLPRSSI